MVISHHGIRCDGSHGCHGLPDLSIPEPGHRLGDPRQLHRKCRCVMSQTYLQDPLSVPFGWSTSLQS